MPSDHEQPVSRAELEGLFPIYAGTSGKRRFEDDKAALRRAGIPLRSEAPEGEKGTWYYEIRREDYELPELDLSDEERVALNLAVRSIDFSDVVWGRLAGTKLGMVGSAQIATVAELPGIEVLPALAEAVRGRTRLSLAYNGNSRYVDPYGLVLKHGHWYLVAHDHRRDQVIPFRVDRIEEQTIEVVGDGAFEVPAGFDAAARVPDEAIGMGEDPPVEAVVRLDGRIAELVASSVGADCEPDGDDTILRMPVRYRPAFVSWVLGFGELAVVEEPPDLRQAVVTRLKELANR
ncbi:MAG: Protein PafB [Acidimicrobiales bacterium]|nr:Protein PafB [Acidimicrobiales bacterium]